jgi:hypothetical protein
MKNTQKGARYTRWQHHDLNSRVISEYFCSGMSHPESNPIEDNRSNHANSIETTTQQARRKKDRKSNQTSHQPNKTQYKQL